MDLSRQRLSTKLVWVAIAFLVVALTAIGLTLFESWKLEGGAAAINDMGSERMRSYRIAYLLSENVSEPSAATEKALRDEMRRMEEVLAVLKRGDPARPLVLPRDDGIVAALNAVEKSWGAHIKPLIERALKEGDPARRRELARVLRADIENFVARIDEIVFAVELNNARNIALLRYMQLGLIALAIAGTVALIYLMFLLVVRPVVGLHEGMQRMALDEFGTRLPVETRDEFGELAAGFNRMASHLEDLYTTLEERVAIKTRDLAEKNRELAALYDVTTLLNEAGTIEDLCRGFLRKLMELLGAQAGAVRLIDTRAQQIHLYAHEGLPAAFAREEQCLSLGECLCGEAAQRSTSTVEFLPTGGDANARYRCQRAGFRTLSVFAIRFRRQLLGMFNLFFTGQRVFSSRERQMLETLGQHLGVAIENQRLVSRDKELAVFEERNLLAQQLHDSIAQSLAFLNIQVQMIEDSFKRNAIAEVPDAIGRIREGVQESYADVRELLTHFRTRVKHEEDLGLALRNMLERFERQTGIRTVFRETGSGVPLSPENQLQVLNILQEALSNVRKHSGASVVTLETDHDRGHRFRVRDDGRGFDPQHPEVGTERHIGLRIMRERAQRIGGSLAVNSRPGAGTEVVLAIPVTRKEGAA
ncbi:MAG: type IV pili methyl-accepting chemotaxis transducer N-terminal domain-containing protein [Betaproteobacteria bacterium]|nr:type IV pili methyl-accepting chemotaxis transducer N-terminal domain-containing protein [Betaproteobacteria bacterium]